LYHKHVIHILIQAKNRPYPFVQYVLCEQLKMRAGDL